MQYSNGTIHRDMVSLCSVDLVTGEDFAALYTQGLLNWLSCLPPYKINMKIGAPTMLFKNINISREHNNGAKLLGGGCLTPIFIP